MKKLNIINFLRGFSITTIVLMHLLQNYDLPEILMKATSFGGAGVHVFILCSGFGLYLSHLNKPLTYKKFLLHRFSRIYWPMAIICISTALWMMYQGKEIIMPLLSNLFLFKMFIPELECSMGEQMWFISTIIQFYLAWPLILKLININRWKEWVLCISLLWATFVGVLGYSEEGIWNSFFLQYLWEFCLGMKLAELYKRMPKCLKIPKWIYLIPTSLVGLTLTGIMGWMGFPWKLYNDIPSLVGYMSLALMIYKINLRGINRFLCFTNSISYEWYLVHLLVFQIVRYFFSDRLSACIEILVCLTISYLVAIGYAQLFRPTCYSKK